MQNVNNIVSQYTSYTVNTEWCWQYQGRYQNHWLPCNIAAIETNKKQEKQPYQSLARASAPTTTVAPKTTAAPTSTPAPAKPPQTTIGVQTVNGSTHSKTSSSNIYNNNSSNGNITKHWREKGSDKKVTDISTAGCTMDVCTLDWNVFFFLLHDDI